MRNNLPIRAEHQRKDLSAMLLMAAIAFFSLVSGNAIAQDTTAVEDPEVIIDRDTLQQQDPEVVVETVDTLDQEVPDTVRIKSYAERFDPRKAILYAAVLPGLGQVYNKKYWKLPLVYGGFVFIGHYIKTYNDLYVEYRGYLFDNLEQGLSGDNDENPEIRLTTGQIRTIVDKARRERDFMIILMGGMYILQMVDAHVDAHLKEFDLNPQLQVSIEPAMDQSLQTGRTIGVALVVKF
ncbi:MAG TPA: DUF5683 domain-containing protein [Chryseosolibacter sp.]|nr:DUF5683 domain-containing protein [Chryseosolibacter sp.]